MSCESWKEALVSHLYGELAPEEENRLSDHLASCEACRERLEELSAARRLLGEAQPVVPSVPRVLVLRGLSRRPSLMAFAAGFACAALLLGAGLTGGWYLAGGYGETPVRLANFPVELPPTESASTPSAATIDEINRRLDEQRGQLAVLMPSGTPQEVLTRNELESILAQLQRDVGQRRTQDLQVLLEEIAGVEVRTGERIGQTEEALGYVMLASDPRVKAH